jgi:RNA polymerase sigma-70 factor, ECF subfamily
MTMSVSIDEATASLTAADLLQSAREGSATARGQLLEMCRTYLVAVADRRIEQDLRTKVAVSDLVQDTFLEAHRDFDGFAGASSAELLSWLSKIMLNNLFNQTRHYCRTEKRQLSREVSLDEVPVRNGDEMELLADTPTPSRCIMAKEKDQALVEALTTLPARHRMAIMLRNQMGLSFQVIGEHLGCTADAARKLWARAVERLQQELERADANY